MELDEGGFVPVDRLLEALERFSSWPQLKAEHLEEVIRFSDKARYEIREGKIRAMYGHTVPVRLRYEPVEPPEFLWHGTSRRVEPRIRRDGLRPMDRQYVHLSVDPTSARQVGLRQDRFPVVLQIRAAEAAKAGLKFYRGNDAVWMADGVPPEFIGPPS